MNRQCRCRRCQRVMCRTCYSSTCAFIPLAPCVCGPCDQEQARVTKFQEKMLPMLKEGAMFVTGKGFLSRGDNVWASYDDRTHRFQWKSMKLERNKPSQQGAVQLADLTRVDKRGADLAIIEGGGRTAVTLTAPNPAVADVWEHAIHQLMSLRQALLGVPHVDVERLTSLPSPSTEDSVEENLLAKQKESEGQNRVSAAKARLSRLSSDAAARKAKYKDVGMTHVSLCVCWDV